MPGFYVHGVPDTHRVWSRVLELLERDDVATPDLPGFGCAVPDDFDATKEAYLDWLVGEVEAVGEPVDLVAHDWGAILALRLLDTRPDLVRTWALGSAPLTVDEPWHQVASLWQTPGVGEEVMEAFTPEAFQAGASGLGLDAEAAAVVSEYLDDRMKACILALYRSAVDVGAEWFSDPARTSVPGLAIWGADDLYAGAAQAGVLAETRGAGSLVFDDCGHWWPIERPADVAAALEDLWAQG